MGQINQFVRVETHKGKSIATAFGKITPISQVLFIRFPFGGYVWNRPIAIEVQTDQAVNRIRILDVDRLIRMGLSVISFVIVVLFWLFSRKPSGEK